ncbi:MAG: NAD-dependent epimerase/dehydratase family protein [Verrucomicrobiota bacterium]|nr:NAD-dependent epimerase/dehydratase family protein [Verrucomicrobiota bacterium]
MRRILIVGCGYVGQKAADVFHEAGWKVEGWTASAESASALSAKPYPVVPHDASDPACVESQGGRFDAVVQCASSAGGDAEAYRRVYLRVAENLVRAFADVTLLFTSSTSVYAQLGGELVDEKSAADPQRETAKVLRETENLILAHGGIVARLAGIYGPGRSALLRKFLRGEAAAGVTEERFVNYVHRDDVAAALFILINQRAELAPPRIYNVVDDTPLPLTKCYELLAEILPTRLPADDTLPAAASKRGPSNKRVSNTKLRALGWSPRYRSFREGMEQSVIPQRE